MANNPAYNSKQYKTNRTIVLQGNPDCALCGGPGANSADHIIPLMHGGTHDLDNLRAVHVKCNARKGAIDQAKAQQATRQRREAGMQTRNTQTANSTKNIFYTPTITDRKSVV